MSRLDRTGEPISDDDEGVRQAHDPRCRNGWLGYDTEMRPIPCVQCRPNLRTPTDVNDYGQPNSRSER